MRFACQMGKITKKGDWKFVVLAHGEVSATMAGHLPTLKLCAENWE